MLKVGIEQSAYLPYGEFENQIKKLKEHGFECLDYAEFCRTDGNPMFETMTKEEFSAYVSNQKSILDRYGIRVSQTHAPWRYPPREANKEEQEARLKQMIRAVEGTALLGCDRFVVHAMMPHSTHSIGHEKEDLAVNLWFLKELCKAGRENGVYICLENMPMLRFSIATVQQVLDVVELVNDKMMKVCLDTGHSLIFELDPGDAVRMIGKDLLYALHVHDNDGSADRHWLPFTGKTKWPNFTSALREIGFEGVMSLECTVEYLPLELMDYELVGLRKKAQYLAKLADCKEA